MLYMVLRCWNSMTERSSVPLHFFVDEVQNKTNNINSESKISLSYYESDSGQKWLHYIPEGMPNAY